MVSVGEALFAGTKAQVLRLFFSDPDRKFYVKEVLSLLRAGRGAVQRESAQMAEAGLLVSERIGNQKFYQANSESPIFDELVGIVHKTFGIADSLKDILHPVQGKISLAMVYGSVAKKTDKANSDIDLLVVSDDLAYMEIMTLLSEKESQLRRSVNPTLLTGNEFNKKLSKSDSFVNQVLAEPKIILIGSESDIESFRKSG